ncbi:hypothetical protein [Paenibacillus apiarius]|uniref:hypothetical protein n=1 Tax=Paenibacillus apiarius TaxID=46240 RepID=UPI003B3A2FD3
MTTNYGTVVFEGKEFQLTGDADFTNRVLDGRFTNFHEASEGEEFEFEMSAPGVDAEGNEVTVYWIFSDIKNEQKELDEYDYDSINRVVYK